MERSTKIRITKVLKKRRNQAFNVGDVLGVVRQLQHGDERYILVDCGDGTYRYVTSYLYEWEYVTAKMIQEELLDKAEEAALKRAEQAAYECTERVAPDVQKKLYDNLYGYISTGVRLMREELIVAIESMNKNKE